MYTSNVKKGERVIFINNDAVDYNLKIENLASGQIPAGKSYTLETASASLGIYEFYLEEYPNNKSVLIIQ